MDEDIDYLPNLRNIFDSGEHFLPIFKRESIFCDISLERILRPGKIRALSKLDNW